jgi:phospholipid/cholesterol/gamma-HCH transport system substrate-binding protein
VYAALIVGFALLAIGVGAYILIHQRLQLPFQSRYTLTAEFPNTEALTPGLGEPANVAGVKVGEISSAKLVDGRSVVTMSIDPGKLRHVYANARATLFPNTPLQDMEIDISPGGPPAPLLRSGQMIPVDSTQVPIPSDSLLNALDADTRDYFTSLVAGTGAGLAGRGPDLRALLRALGPTSRQIRELSDALAARRVALQRVIHNLSALAVAASAKDRQIGQVVAAGKETLHAIASQDQALARSIALLPGTLGQAQRTLSDATAFTNQLGPTLQALEPGARKLPSALHSADKLTRASLPVLHNDVAPLVRAAIPVLTNLLPAARDLVASTPDLTNVAQLVEYLANELLYNPGAPRHSYLYWLVWFAHNAASNTSTADAYGSAIRGIFQVSCSSLSATPQLAPIVQLLFGTTGCT